jgi:UDP-N-acetylmuramate: L-alanyl-gamma-D-glutamyl-meso-diaminopimelate ligase
MKVHLIAIGGTGMGSVAGLLAEAGHEVRGSDLALYPPMSTLLERLEIPLYQGYAPSNLDWGPELVVLGNTCSTTHVEYLAARERGLPIVSFPQLLSDHFLAERHSLVVAGTHGKTTTTSLLAYLLDHAGLEPGFLIGGVPANFGRGFALGKPPYFVIEGDEYDSACFDKRPKFVHYRARTAILTSVEFDHVDIYPDVAAFEAAFVELIAGMPADGTLIVAGDDPRALSLCATAPCAVQTYTVQQATGAAEVTDQDGAPPAGVTWFGRYWPSQPGDGSTSRTRQQLEIWHDGERLGLMEVPLLGRHNMANTLAAVAAAHDVGVELTPLVRAIDGFQGVARRQQVRGVVDGVTVIDDFAHHPTAIRETLQALRGVHGSGRLIAVFEPRSSTSRRNVFRYDLPQALRCADQVFVAPLYQPEKVPAHERLDIQGVIADINATNCPASLLPVDQIVTQLAASCTPGDTVVVMSSGGFDGLIDRLLHALEAR